MSKKLINIRIEEDLKKRAAIKAIQTGTTLTKVITDILQQFVK